MPDALYTILTFAKINTKRFFRDRLSIFFGILFPLIFLFVFGGVFGATNQAAFRVALINKSDSEFATQLSARLAEQNAFEVRSDLTIDEAREKMVRSQLDATIELPPEFGVNSPDGMPRGQVSVYYTQNTEQSGRTLVTVLEGIFKDVNTSLTKVDDPFTVKGEKISEHSLAPFDYTFAGMLGFALLGMGIFGPVNVFPELKKQGILRRLSTTPLRVWQYFCAMAISQSIIGLVSIGVMFIVALTVFNLEVVGNPFVVAIFLLFALVEILGIGLAIGGWAQNERRAALLGNIVTFPMMFLSGTFIPRYLMPEWLQNISSFLPLTPVIDGVRYVVNEGYSLVQLAPQLGLMAAWTIVIYLIAFKVFRWE